MKELTEEEVMEAADRFLQPALVAERRKYFMEFGVEELEAAPNCAEKERVKRGVKEEITTLDQWKRLLPDSYQEVVEFKKLISRSTSTERSSLVSPSRSSRKPIATSTSTRPG